MAFEKDNIGIIGNLRKKNVGNMSGSAVDYGGKRLSFEEFLVLCEHMRDAFISLNGSDNVNDKVAIIAPSTTASVAAFFGIMDANKTALMVPPGYLGLCSKDIKKFLNGCETVFLFSDYIKGNSLDILDKLQQAGVKKVVLTSSSDCISDRRFYEMKKQGEIFNNPLADVSKKKGLPNMEYATFDELNNVGSQYKICGPILHDPLQTAVVFVTGGTTGTPKQVKHNLGTFKQLSDIYDKMMRAGLISYRPGDKNLSIIPLHYGTGAINGIYGALLCGMFTRLQDKPDVYTLADNIIKFRPDLLALTPSLLMKLYKVMNGKQCDINQVALGGEAIYNFDKYLHIAQKLGVKNLMNGYGSTELFCMIGMGQGNGFYPLPGITVKAVKFNPNGTITELHPGEIGSIVVKTPCATTGYANVDGGLNGSLFVTVGGEKYVSTGDIGAINNDGTFIIKGRANEFYNSNNSLCFMPDIACQVLECPYIQEAKVVKFKIKGKECPAVYAVLKDEYKNKILDVLGFIHDNVSKDIIGTCFIDEFSINPISCKLDLGILVSNPGSFFGLSDDGKACCTNVDGDELKCIEIPLSDVGIEKLKGVKSFVRTKED